MNSAVMMYAIQALEAIPQLLAAGQSVVTLVNQTTTSLKAMEAEKRDPNPDEWLAQAKVISDLRAILHAG